MMARKKIYSVVNEANEQTFVYAASMLGAIDLWRAENYDSKAEPEDQEWPVSCALVYDGLILGLDS
jgi:hypothetical protein